MPTATRTPKSKKLIMRETYTRQREAGQARMLAIVPEIMKPTLKEMADEKNLAVQDLLGQLILDAAKKFERRKIAS